MAHPKEEVDYYKQFGLELGASDEDIKKRHKELALKLHPDKNQDDPDAQKKFQEMQETFLFLSTPESKAMIDQWAIERAKKQTVIDKMDKKRKQREWEELEAERAVKFRPCLYYDPETGLFTKSLDRIQAYSTIFESVAKMKERFERDNKDIQ